MKWEPVTTAIATDSTLKYAFCPSFPDGPWDESKCYSNGANGLYGEMTGYFMTTIGFTQTARPARLLLVAARPILAPSRCPVEIVPPVGIAGGSERLGCLHDPGNQHHD